MRIDEVKKSTKREKLINDIIYGLLTFPLFAFGAWAFFSKLADGGW